MDLGVTNLSLLTDFIPTSTYNKKSVRFSVMLAVCFMSYCCGYNCLKRFLKAFVINESIPRINQLRLTDAIWRLIFSIWIVSFFSFSLQDLKCSSFIGCFINATTSPQPNITLYKLEGFSSSETTFLVAPISFFFHQLYLSATSSIVEPAIVSMCGLALFVFSTYSAGCSHLCLQILLFLALNVGTLELSRVIYALKSRCRGFKGPPAPSVLHLIAAPVFILHLCTWTVVNLYLFPILYMSLPSVRERNLLCPSATAYINIFLIIFAYKQLFKSPMWSLFKVLVQRPSERRATPKSFPAVVLLPYTSSLLPELRAIQMNFLLDAIPTSAEQRMIRKKILSSGGHTSAPVNQGKADLLSIVKYVKILKRKMRNRYEQNNADSQDSRVQTDSEIENSLDGNDNSSSEVTDIFIPVPSVGNIDTDTAPPKETVEVTADVHCPDWVNHLEEAEDETTFEERESESDETERQEDNNPD